MHYEHMDKYRDQIIELKAKTKRITDDFFVGNPWYDDYGEQRLLKQVNSITHCWIALNKELRSIYGYKHGCRKPNKIG